MVMPINTAGVSVTDGRIEGKRSVIEMVPYLKTDKPTSGQTSH